MLGPCISTRIPGCWRPSSPSSLLLLGLLPVDTHPSTTRPKSQRSSLVLLLQLLPAGDRPLDCCCSSQSVLGAQQLRSPHLTGCHCRPASTVQGPNAHQHYLKSTVMLLQDLSWQPSNNVPAAKSLKALARDGIPPELRPTLWFQLSGGLALKKAAPPNYYRSLTRLGSKEAKLGGISSSDADMFRTFRQAWCSVLAGAPTTP